MVTVSEISKMYTIELILPLFFILKNRKIFGMYTNKLILLSIKKVLKLNKEYKINNYFEQLVYI